MKDSIAAYIMSGSATWPSTSRATVRPPSRASLASCSPCSATTRPTRASALPEYRVDFGKDRSVKPIDWAFFQNGRPIFFVEAKEVGKRLPGYDEQLADYFAKAPEAKLGILTNSVQWRYLTDVMNMNVMDREPFLEWDALSDEEPPHDFLTVLQKSQYNAELIRAFARRKRAQNLLVGKLNRLLEPSPEFVWLAITNIETRKLTENALETWKPVLANAINEWAT